MNARLKKVLEAVKKASREAKVHPQDLTQSVLFEYNEDLTAQDLRVLGGFKSVIKAHFPYTDKDLKTIKRIKNRNSYIGKLENAVGSKGIFEEEFLNTIKEKGKLIKVKPYKSSKQPKIKRELTLVLSDLHIGSDILAEEVGHSFGKVEEARRLAKIVKQTIEYKQQYRKATRLNLLLLGDIFQNTLHDQRDGAPVAEQVSRAMHLLNQAIQQLSSNFPSIRIYATSGNHGRNLNRHHGRAVNQKWDSIESMLYSGLKASSSSLKNVEFHIPKTPYFTYDVFGKKIFASHGDSVLNPGYPNKSINIKGLEGQINKINASLPDNREYSVFINGHVHTASTTYLNNGSVMLTNGALVPPDSYAVSIGLFECQNGQYIFESVEGYPFGDSRLIRVNEEDDKDSSLDKVIKPWVEL